MGGGYGLWEWQLGLPGQVFSCCLSVQRLGSLFCWGFFWRAFVACFKVLVSRYLSLRQTFLFLFLMHLPLQIVRPHMYSYGMAISTLISYLPPPSPPTLPPPGYDYRKITKFYPIQFNPQTIHTSPQQQQHPQQLKQSQPHNPFFHRRTMSPMMLILLQEQRLVSAIRRERNRSNT